MESPRFMKHHCPYDQVAGGPPHQSPYTPIGIQEMWLRLCFCFKSNFHTNLL